MHVKRGCRNLLYSTLQKLARLDLHYNGIIVTTLIVTYRCAYACACLIPCSCTPWPHGGSPNIVGTLVITLTLLFFPMQKECLHDPSSHVLQWTFATSKYLLQITKLIERLQMWLNQPSQAISPTFQVFDFDLGLDHQETKWLRHLFVP